MVNGRSSVGGPLEGVVAVVGEGHGLTLLLGRGCTQSWSQPREGQRSQQGVGGVTRALFITPPLPFQLPHPLPPHGDPLRQTQRSKVSVLTSSFCRLDSGFAPGTPAGDQREDTDEMSWAKVVEVTEMMQMVMMTIMKVSKTSISRCLGQFITSRHVPQVMQVEMVEVEMVLGRRRTSARPGGGAGAGPRSGSGL